MKIELDYCKEGIRGIHVSGRNILKGDVQIDNLPAMLRFLSEMKNVIPSTAGKIDYNAFFERLRVGDTSFSTSGHCDPQTSQIRIDSIQVGGLKIADGFESADMDDILGFLETMIAFRKKTEKFDDCLKLMNVNELFAALGQEDEALQQFKSKYKKELRVLIENHFFEKGGVSTQDEVYKAVTENEMGKRIIKNKSEELWKHWTNDIIKDLNITRARRGEMVFEKPESPPKYEERKKSIMKVMYKVDPDKTKTEGWALRELKTYTDCDINMLHKVIKLMRWERCIVVVGGNGTVNGALRYAPVEFNYENYKRDFEKPSPKEVLL